MSRIFLIAMLALSVCLAGTRRSNAEPTAAEPTAMEKAAARLQAATVTVRVIPGQASDSAVRESASRESASRESGPSEPADEEDTGKEPARRVAICSGVSLGEGWLVTHIDLAPQAKIRVTLPGGDQSEARLAVVDHYSGLSLLRIEKRDMPALELAGDEEPRAGSRVLSAAGWGVEEPVVSMGIVSGSRRSIRNATLPPLVQCDIRTTESSSGAALAGSDGKLLGVIIATDADQDRRGFCYAMPVRHVKRLLRAKPETADKIVVLKRYRPLVGMVLDQGKQPGQVVVRRVNEKGPAAKAGIRTGERVIACDGYKIRFAYQAVRAALQRQPGDKLSFLVENQQGEQRKVDVTLAGGVEMPAPTYPGGERSLQIPRYVIEWRPDGKIAAVAPGGTVRPIADFPPPPPKEAKDLTPDQRLAQYQEALRRYTAYIARLHAELRRRDGERATSDTTIRDLKLKVEQLQRRLDAAKAPPQE